MLLNQERIKSVKIQTPHASALCQSWAWSGYLAIFYGSSAEFNFRIFWKRISSEAGFEYFPKKVLNTAFPINLVKQIKLLWSYKQSDPRLIYKDI